MRIAKRRAQLQYKQPLDSTTNAHTHDAHRPETGTRAEARDTPSSAQSCQTSQRARAAGEQQQQIRVHCIVARSEPMRIQPHARTQPTQATSTRTVRTSDAVQDGDGHTQQRAVMPDIATEEGEILVP